MTPLSVSHASRSVVSPYHPLPSPPCGPVAQTVPVLQEEKASLASEERSQGREFASSAVGLAALAMAAACSIHPGTGFSAPAPHLASAATRTHSRSEMIAPGQRQFVRMPNNECPRPAEVFVGVPVRSLDLNSRSMPATVTAIRVTQDNVGISTDGRYLVIGSDSPSAHIDESEYRTVIRQSPGKTSISFPFRKADVHLQSKSVANGVRTTIESSGRVRARVSGGQSGLKVEIPSGPVAHIYPYDDPAGIINPSVLQQSTNNVNDLITCRSGSIVAEKQQPVVFTPTGDEWKIEAKGFQVSIKPRPGGFILWSSKWRSDPNFDPDLNPVPSNAHWLRYQKESVNVLQEGKGVSPPLIRPEEAGRPDELP